MKSPHLRSIVTATAVALACTIAPAQNARGSPGMPGEIVLKLQSTANFPALQSKYSLTLLATLGARPIYRVMVPAGTDAGATIDALRLELGVQIAEPNPVNQSPEARKSIAWAIGTQAEYLAQWAPQAMRLPEAQALSTGAGVRVAVIDTGIDPTHPVFAGRLLPGRDWVDGDNDPTEGGTLADPGFGHGTHVAGLIALAAPGASIMPLRVLDPTGSGHMWAVAEAMIHAIDPDLNPLTDDGAQVINLSLGSLSRSQIVDTLMQIAGCNPPARGAAFDLSDPGYDDDKARCRQRRGAVVLAAAGNDASAKVKEYPAAENAYGLVPVAASAADRTLAAFSNSGNWISVAAPGDRITSAAPGGGYATWSGTSMASPLAAGAVALARALDPAISSKNLGRKVVDTSAAMCGGTLIRQVDALALLQGVAAPAVPCP